jgi:hypothetical protein
MHRVLFSIQIGDEISAAGTRGVNSSESKLYEDEVTIRRVPRESNPPLFSLFPGPRRAAPWNLTASRPVAPPPSPTPIPFTSRFSGRGELSPRQRPLSPIPGPARPPAAACACAFPRCAIRPHRRRFGDRSESDRSPGGNSSKQHQS